jgi:hypothetical protein
MIKKQTMGERKWYTIGVRCKHNPKLMFVLSSYSKSEQPVE